MIDIRDSDIKERAKVVSISDVRVANANEKVVDWISELDSLKVESAELVARLSDDGIRLLDKQVDADRLKWLTDRMSYIVSMYEDQSRKLVESGVELN